MNQSDSSNLMKLKLALDNMNNSNKTLQKEANDYLENFTNNKNLDFPIICDLLKLDNNIYNHFISVCLFVKIENNFESFSDQHEKELTSFLNNLSMKFEKNSLLLKNFTKCSGYLILKHFEKGNFLFLEFLDNLERDLNLINLACLTNIFTLLDNSSIKSKVKYMLESEIKFREEKILNMIIFCMKNNLYGELISDLIESLCQIKFSFLSHPFFIHFFLEKIKEEIENNNFSIFENKTQVLLKMIDKSNESNYLEYSNFKMFLEDYKNVIQIFQNTNDLEHLIKESSKIEENRKSVISIYIICLNLECIKKFSINYFSQLFSNLIQNFSQFLLFKSKIFDLIIENLKNNLNLIDNHPHEFYLMMEFLSSFLAIYLSEKNEIEQDIKLFWLKFVIEGIPFFINKNKLKNDKEFIYWKNFNFTPTNEIENDKYMSFKEIRDNNGELFLTLVKFLKTISLEEFYENLKNINQQQIEIISKLSHNESIIHLESFIFFTQNCLLYYTEKSEGIFILVNLLQYFFNINYKEVEILYLSLSVLVYSISLDFNNSDIEIYLYKFLFDIFAHFENTINEGIVSESLSNLLYFYNGQFISKEDLGILNKKLLKMVSDMYNSTNFSVVDHSCFGIIENLISSFLKLASRIMNYDPTMKTESDIFFLNLISFFQNLQNQFGISNKLYTYMKVVKNVLENYEEENNNIKRDILNFVLNESQRLNDCIIYCFKNKLFRYESVYLLKTIIRNFELQEIDCFSLTINLLKNFSDDLVDNFEILSLLNNLISKNNDSSIIVNSMSNFFELNKFLKEKCFKQSKVIFSENCDYEEEIVKLDYNLLLYFSNEFLNNINLQQNCELFNYLLAHSGIYNLKKRIINFKYDKKRSFGREIRYSKYKFRLSYPTHS